MTRQAAFLEDRGILTVAGEEARDFLQGLLTLDMNKVSPTKAQAGGLLSPQGKILFDVIILEHENIFWVETSANQAEALAKRLNFYKLRAKVVIDQRSDWAILALWDLNKPCSAGFTDPRWESLGRRAFVEKNRADSLIKELQATKRKHADYHAHRIANAIPEAEKDYTLGDTFPHEANFDLLNGVDFNKGCYVGQEVVSRMQHRGIARKRVMPFAFEGTASIGSPISAGTITLGQLGSHSQDLALGMIRLDRLEEALNAKTDIVAGGAKLNPLQPLWANFAIAGAA